jgi:hypothetical protein
MPSLRAACDPATNSLAAECQILILAGAIGVVCFPNP